MIHPSFILDPSPINLDGAVQIASQLRPSTVHQVFRSVGHLLAPAVRRLCILDRDGATHVALSGMRVYFGFFPPAALFCASGWVVGCLYDKWLW